MNTEQYLSLISRLNNAFPNSTITKWVSEDDHEDIIYLDEEGSRVEIKYFPKIELPKIRRIERSES